MRLPDLTLGTLCCKLASSGNFIAGHLQAGTLLSIEQVSDGEVEESDCAGAKEQEKGQSVVCCLLSQL